MRIKLFTLFFGLAIFALLIPKHLQASHFQGNCMGLYGTVTAVNWPAGASPIQLSCGADNPPGPSQCTGGSASVQPNQSFHFDKCSCLANDCLNVPNSSIPAGCQVEWVNGGYCSDNKQSKDVSFRVVCPPPTTPCPGECGNQPGSNVCVGKVANWLGNKQMDDWCYVKNNDHQKAYCYSCIAPTSSPTPTKIPPACGTDCERDGDCTGDAARDGCTVCLPTGPGGKKVCTKPSSSPSPSTSPSPSVIVPPGGSIPPPLPPGGSIPPSGPTATRTPTPTRTPTATPPVPACNTQCTRPGDCAGARDGCTYCSPGGTCQEPPTPTPTPDPFDEAMCKCEPDSLKYNSIVLGQPLTLKAFGRVEGTDTNYAKIPSFTFSFYESAGGTLVTELERETVNATQIEDTPTLDRYQSDDWVLDLPTTLDTTKTYRIQAKPNCSRKAAMLPNFTNRVVLAEEDEAPKTFIDRIVQFFLNLFRSGRNTVPAPTATPTPINKKGNLQLETLKFSTNIEEGKDINNCTFVKFSF